MTTRIATTLLALMLISPAPADDAKEKAKADKAKADKVKAEKENDLAKAFKDADTIFTGVVSKKNPLGVTGGLRISQYGEMTFKDPTSLKGSFADGGTYSYSYTEGKTKNYEVTNSPLVLVAVKKKAVIAMVPANEANLALAKKSVEDTKKEK